MISGRLFDSLLSSHVFLKPRSEVVSIRQIIGEECIGYDPCIDSIMEKSHRCERETYPIHSLTITRRVFDSIPVSFLIVSMSAFSIFFISSPSISTIFPSESTRFTCGLGFSS